MVLKKFNDVLRCLFYLCPPDRLISSSHMSVGLTLDTDRATKLRFPIRFTITLQLLNQYKDQDHYKRDIICNVSKDAISLVYLSATP